MADNVLPASLYLPPGFLQPGPEAPVPLDRLCALWIDEAPRYGAVITAFGVIEWRQETATAGSVRQLSPWAGFVASFWHPAVFFSSPDGRESWYRDLQESPRTRAQLDARTAHMVGLARRVPVALSGAAKHMAAFAGLGCPEYRPFWSPELPEVIWNERGSGNPWFRWGATIKLLGAS